jgi:hypothetical protein
MQKGEWHWYTGALLLWGQMLPGENLQLTSQISKYFGYFKVAAQRAMVAICKSAKSK